MVAMDDQGKNHEQLVAELTQLRQRVTELEAAEAAHRQARAQLSASEKKYRELYESTLDAYQRDLAEHQRVEQFLRDSEERYRRIVETAREGIWIMDAGGKTTFVNQRMADMLGCTIGEMLYTPLCAFMDEQDYALAADLLERRRRGIAEQRELRFRHRGGTALWAILELTPILDEHGQYAGALAMVTDITERKQAEKTLRASEERFSAAFHFSPIPMAIYRLADGHIVDVNDAFVRTFGYTREETIGHTTYELQLFANPEDRNTIRQILEEQGSLENFEFGGPCRQPF
jgi:PAS domain S-box-containing protein